ncbi:MAG: 16S rRNA (cytosine(1402)-N(4))-methyltransferase RsmH [Desulfuromonadaceae bacterium]|nr:16S rRNA (cytosine(1402)-N(4))-methyltransferase RsmH [Desulfuromonadaceae bacterium]
MASDGENRFHLPVMPEEVLQALAPRSGGVYIDGTVGGGGHARLILERSAPDGFLIGIDRDAEAVEKAYQTLSPFGSRVFLYKGSFADLDKALQAAGRDAVDGVLLDLGVSSHQLDRDSRGFSFLRDAPLDMRMDVSSGMTAQEAVNTLDQEDLERVFRDYGEERFARRIARRIVERRREKVLTSTLQLAELVREAVPGGGARFRIHPATRVFQALRILVNGEMEHLRRGLEKAIDVLAPEGRLVVLTYHSLEARIVKEVFHRETTGCICPPTLPICVCHHRPRLALLMSKGIKPGEEEVAVNPRSRSAVLRGARRVYSCGRNQ